MNLWFCPKAATPVRGPPRPSLANNTRPPSYINSQCVGKTGGGGACVLAAGSGAHLCEKVLRAAGRNPELTASVEKATPLATLRHPSFFPAQWLSREGTGQGHGGCTEDPLRPYWLCHLGQVTSPLSSSSFLCDAHVRNVAMVASAPTPAVSSLPTEAAQNLPRVRIM